MSVHLLALYTWVATRVPRDEKGATAVEYGLMVTLIALVIITAVGLIGTNLDLKFDKVVDALKP
jgi:pilus assembly protein Flp/PilA